MFTGSCLCGDIAWQVDGPLTSIMHCHCSMCRKFHGSTYASFAMADPKDFQWIRGEDKAAEFASSDAVTREYCPRCGSAVASTPEGAPFAFMPLGNVAEDPDASSSTHIFVDSKAPWCQVPDGVTAHAGAPPEFGGGNGLEREDRSGRSPGKTAGSCLCGAVRYAYSGEPTRMVNCHCSRCRRQLSAAFGTFIAVPHAAFEWVSGDDQIVNYKMPDAEFKGSAFCGTCGSQVPRRRDDTSTQIPVGSLDDDPGAKPAANIFVGSKAAWARLDDGVTNHESYPP